MSTVSVIIPVYNVAPYLEECVRSVLAQDYSDIEVILVDDGSTDDSPSLCDAFAAEDARVRVIHQKNSGLAAARNTGTAAGTSEWLLYLDSDDYYAKPDTISRLLQAADADTDVVVFNYCRAYDNARASAPLCPAIARSATPLQLVSSTVYVPSACTKMVRASLLSQNRIDFEIGSLTEDIFYSAMLLAYAAKIRYVPDVVYSYRVRAGSLTQTVSKKHAADSFHAIRRCAALAEHALPERRRCILDYAAYRYCTLLINIHKARLKNDDALCREIYSMRSLLQYDDSNIVRLVGLFAKCFGIRLAALALFVYSTTRDALMALVSRSTSRNLLS